MVCNFLKSDEILPLLYRRGDILSISSVALRKSTEPLSMSATWLHLTIRRDIFEYPARPGGSICFDLVESGLSKLIIVNRYSVKR